MKNLQIVQAKEVDLVLKNKKEGKIYLVYFPYSAQKTLQKNHKKIVPELEKKLRGSVLTVLKRTILSKWIKANRSQTRPRSRTLTAVYDSVLDDLVQPANIIGKRIRHRLDGSRVIKVYDTEYYFL